jgi:hypothetical protein
VRATTEAAITLSHSSVRFIWQKGGVDSCSEKFFNIFNGFFIWENLLENPCVPIQIIRKYKSMDRALPLIEVDHV